MSYIVRPTVRALVDVDRHYEWIGQIDPNLAKRWYEAFYDALARVRSNPYTSGLAYENRAFDEEVRHLLFGLDKRRRYRALFVIRDDEIVLLRVRGPGERPIGPGDIDEA